MAIMRPSAIVGDISGSIGGQTFVRSKAGLVISSRGRHTKTTNKAAIQNQATFQWVRAYWKKLTEEQRTQWVQAALIYPHTNRLGIKKPMSGFQMFIAQNKFNNNGAIGGYQQMKLTPSGSSFTVQWKLSSFSVVSGGLKGYSTIGGPYPLGVTGVVYGARTFSNAPRRSWFNWKVVGGGNLGSNLSFWDANVGDPEVGEQCWIKVYQQWIFQPPSPPQIMSTFAT